MEQSDDDDDDFEDCEDTSEGQRAADDDLDDDEELIDECEFSSQDFNMAFMQAINDHKAAYPNGWQQMFEEFKNCMQKTDKPFKAWAMFQ